MDKRFLTTFDATHLIFNINSADSSALKTMKKYLLTLCMALVTIGASARYLSEPSLKSENSFGFHLGYATEVPNVGFGLRYQHFILDHIRVEGVWDYYIQNKKLSMWDLNANIHYVWNIGERVRIYPLVGLGYARWGIHDVFLGNHDQYGQPRLETDHDNRLGVNVGAGLQVALNNSWWVGAEAKLQEMRHYDQGVFDVNITYCF